MNRKKQYLKVIGGFFLVLFVCGGIIALYSTTNHGFSYNIDGFLGNSSLNIEEIKRDIENMDKEEIEETIKKIEKEIERLKGQI